MSSRAMGFATLLLLSLMPSIALADNKSVKAMGHTWSQISEPGGDALYLISDRLPVNNKDGTWSTWSIYDFEKTLKLGNDKYSSMLSEIRVDCLHYSIAHIAKYFAEEKLLGGKHLDIPPESEPVTWELATPGSLNELTLSLLCNTARMIEKSPKDRSHP